MDSKQHQFNVSVVVKADSRREAYRYLADRLDKWFSEQGHKDCVNGKGYRPGTLLAYDANVESEQRSRRTTEDEEAIGRKETDVNVNRTGDPKDAQGDEFEPC